MILKSRITERGINAILIVLLLTVTGFYSCVFGQTDKRGVLSSGSLKNAGNIVRVSPMVKVDTKAESLGMHLNSPYAELKPSLAPNGHRLYFSRSCYPNNTGGTGDQEDIWYSEFDTTHLSWSEPIRLPGELNNTGPNFIENVSLTGDTIILGNQYMKKGKMRNGVSYSVNINGEWSPPQPIYIENDYNISNHENHFVNLKNGVVISAVQRVDAVGDRDLYVSFWDGEYATEPVNMGGVLNTMLEESSPYLASDNKTLYFASKGHNGFGNYDIFVAHRLDDTWTNWTTPENLGPAINGASDEEFFTITHCGRYAIFSKRIGISNVDLFKIETQSLFHNPEIKMVEKHHRSKMTLSKL